MPKLHYVPHAILGFVAWLATQKHRHDPVGDIAGDLLDDDCWDGDARSAFRHIHTIHPTTIERLVFAALRRAIRDHRAYLRAHARCNQI